MAPPPAPPRWPLQRVRFRAMGCPCALLPCGPPRRVPRAARAARCEIARLERKYSGYRTDSLAAAIARSAGDPRGLELAPEIAALLDYAAQCHVQSGGLFDISCAPLRRAWRFERGCLPTRRELAQVRRLVGWQRVRWRRPQLVLPRAGMELDFGGLVKEYALDRAAQREGVEHGLVDLGGDLRAIGPQPGGRPWLAGIRDPALSGRALRRVAIAGQALATSGDYERGMTVCGRRYGHILNPLSGRPLPRPLVSVSVLAPSCLVAGTATTIAMLLGERAAAGWLSELGLPELTLDRAGNPGGALAA